jgi:hypothetical protein
MRDASLPGPLATLGDPRKSPFQIATDINFCDEASSLNAPEFPRASACGPAAQGRGSLPVVGKISLVQSI